MIEIKTGQLEVIYNEKTYSLDLILLKLMSEEVESDFPSKTVNGMTQPSVGFLAEYARRLESDLGMEGASPTAAYQVWVATTLEFTKLKKSIDSIQSLPTGSTSTPTT